MVSRGGRCKMPCESCAVQFSVFRRKRSCSECERFYCSACLRRGGGICSPCRALSTRPLARHSIAHLKVRDLQCFLQRQNVSTRGCVEKEELVSLCVSHVNSAAYKRRGAHASPPGPFTSLKGLTNNLNVFINSAFDLRPPPPPPHPPATAARPAGQRVNPAQAPPPRAPPAPAPRERFTTTPGGETDIRVPVPPAAEVPHSESTENAHVDTADCFEIEDLADSGWEVVNRPAEPLPNDSEVLMTAPVDPPPDHDYAIRGGLDGGLLLSPGAGRWARGGRASPGDCISGGTPQRAASELDLHRSEGDTPDTADTNSLQDEPLMDRTDSPDSIPLAPDTPQHLTLDSMSKESELEALNVKQLKELLARNRVEYRGCLERAELLQRARMLWQDHYKFKGVVDHLPLEECCKICMAAPLECVLLECGHIAACTACAKQLAECPICRQFVVRAVRFFRS